MKSFSNKLDVNIDTNILKENAQKIIQKIQGDKEYLQKIGIFIGAGVLLFIGTNLLNSYFNGNISIATKKQKEYQEISSFMSAYNTTYKAYQSDMSHIEGKILQKTEIDKGILMITKIAEQHNVKIINSKKADKSKKVSNGISSQQVDINVEGSYSNVLNFLNNIENMSFFISVDAFTVDKGNKSADTITSKITYRIYCLDDTNSETDKNKTDKK